MAGAGTGVSVVMPVKNDTERALRAIRSVRSELPGCEVVLVDNDADRPAVALALAADRYTVVGGPVGAARLQGLRSATRPNILFLDADHVVVPGSLSRPLEMLDSADAVVLAERSSGTGVLSRLLDAERMLTEAVGLGIPRLYRRDAIDRVVATDPAVGTMVFGEDSALAAGARRVEATTAPVLLHEDPKSLRMLAAKYARYGRRSSAQAGGCGLRRRRGRSLTPGTLARAALWTGPVVALKAVKVVAFGFGRARSRLEGAGRSDRR